MIVLYGILCALFVLFFHECGHYISAKWMRLTVDKVGFAFKPFPRLYVSVIDVNMSMCQRILYLLSGNGMTFLLFGFFLLSGIESKLIYYILACQLIVEANPFYSDYVVAIVSFLYKDRLRQIFLVEKYAALPEEKDPVKQITEEYTYSKIWYLHFGIWFFVVILLLSPKYLINLM